MTEKMENTELHSIHWGGFAFSLVAAPVLVTSALQLPLVAVAWIAQNDALRPTIGLMWVLIMIGAALYFLIGTPVLIWHLRRHAPKVGRIVALSLMSLFWILPIAGLFSLALFELGPLYLAGISIVFGLIGAPPLAAIFTLFYIRFLPA